MPCEEGKASAVVRLRRRLVVLFDDDAHQNKITQYFNGVASALKTFAAAGGIGYAAGVYGSGDTCSVITSASLSKFGWLAQFCIWVILAQRG